ncbi:MAG: RND transporter [Thiotrichales bacterium]|nr:MAG: RND transporter [Thiotrichales bacterium]
MFNWIDRLPVKALLVVAVFFALVPFQPEPHLFEKLRMLFEGSLTRPIDIFDLFMHSLPIVLLAIRLIRIKMYQ